MQSMPDTDRKESIINVLDIKVANLIAAGEVVDRPASVIKELMENAIDAKAENIVVEIKNGGISMMRVTDDGCGMSRDDVAICIKRHATSKIKNAADLNAIGTLGFRGEALAAISAVSKMRIITRRASDELGTRMESVDGNITCIEETGCREGTTIIVEELFANVPARKKFLKKDSAETMAVNAVVEKIALSHPELSFKFICDGNLRYQTVGDGDLRSAAYSVLGREFAKGLIKVNSEENGVSVNGYIGSPELVKKNRTQENFFINGRYVKSATASAALEAAFSTYIPSDKFPACMLHLTIHPALVDVNVHPAKMEVKFSNEKVVFDAVYSAVRGALVHNIVRPGYDVGSLKSRADTEKNRLLNSFLPISERGTGVEKYETRNFLSIEYDEEQKKVHGRSPQSHGIAEGVNTEGERPMSGKYDPDKKDTSDMYETAAAIEARDYLKRKCESDDETVTAEKSATVYKNVSDNLNAENSDVVGKISEYGKPSAGYLFECRTDSGERNDDYDQTYVFNVESGSRNLNSKENIPDYKIMGIAANAYIFVEFPDRLTVIDKHAAHERIIFEQMKKNLYSKNGYMQLLLVPIEILLSREEEMVVEEYRAEIESTGFDFTFRDGKVSLLKIPGELDNAAAEAVFEEMLHRLISAGAGASEVRNEIYEKALFQASCKAALKAGRDDDMSHIKWICDEVIGRPEIKFCPHGRPVAFDITIHDLERRFKRI